MWGRKEVEDEHEEVGLRIRRTKNKDEEEEKKNKEEKKMNKIKKWGRRGKRWRKRKVVEEYEEEY